MIYLILAVASSAMISVVMRISEKYVKNQMGMFMANYTCCILLSYIFLNQKSNVSMSSLSANTVIMGIISGSLYLTCFILLKVNMQHNGIVLASTFMKLGVLIPTVMAVIVFHERPEWTQVVGICISLVAIVMIHFEKESIQEGNKKSWLLILLLMSGITDSMANIFEHVGNASDKDRYLLITFFAAFTLAAILALTAKQKISVKDLVWGALIGIPNYFSARFLLLSLGSVSAVLVYPIYSVGTIITITLVGTVLFREVISKKKMYALELIVLALILLNI